MGHLFNTATGLIFLNVFLTFSTPSSYNPHQMFKIIILLLIMIIIILLWSVILLLILIIVWSVQCTDSKLWLVIHIST